MTYSTTFESTLLDLVTAVIMLPVQIVAALPGQPQQRCKLCAPYRRYIAKGAALAATAALLVACPALALGLVTIMAYGLFTYPMHKAVGA